MQLTTCSCTCTYICWSKVFLAIHNGNCIVGLYTYIRGSCCIHIHVYLLSPSFNQPHYGIWEAKCVRNVQHLSLHPLQQWHRKSLHTHICIYSYTIHECRAVSQYPGRYTLNGVTRVATTVLHTQPGRCDPSACIIAGQTPQEHN